MRDAREIKRQASGHWKAILGTMAPQLADALSNPRKHRPCSVHGGKDGLRAFKDVAETGGMVCNTCGKFADGFATLQWANGWDFPTTVQAVDEWLNGTPITTHQRSAPAPKPADDPQAELRRQQRVEATWAACQRMSFATTRYLQVRGLGGIRNRVPKTLRSHEALQYFDSNSNQVGKYPAMVAPFTNVDRELISLHRTYLTEQGTKAPVPCPKKIMSPAKPGSLNGCAIWLFEPAPEMAACEGIETALAVHLITGLPVIATGTAGLMRTLRLPGVVQCVHVYADKDRSVAGEDAARDLVRRLAGAERRTARILLPKMAIPDGAKSVDWLDVWNAENSAKAGAA